MGIPVITPSSFPSLITFSDYFKDFYGEERVKHVILIKATFALDKLVARRNKKVDRYHRAQDFLKEKGKRATHRVLKGPFSFTLSIPFFNRFVGFKVDTLDYLQVVHQYIFFS